MDADFSGLLRTLLRQTNLVGSKQLPVAAGNEGFVVGLNTAILIFKT